MSSTAVPMQNMGNGYTIVTHVISQPTAPAGTESVVGLGQFKKFLKGEPKTLGYLIAGSLTVAASNKHNRCLVNSSLVLNVFSTISAGIVIILLSLDLAFSRYFYSCYDYGYNCSSYKTLTRGTIGVLLVFSVLQFFISITISAFACKATCNTEPSMNIVTVVPNPLECHPVVSPLSTSSGQQGPQAISSTIMNCPSVENPPPYSEMKGQPVN
ncbi:membrane-spanning 4-domains subfamily A member 12-like isoform X2 [Electrophorus electricus]|uniref:membrane-spanning 4-domains subfamily A member 12-like isoform X2 n=1 Tax=Electrophorus electricus TaxID=8005 RepID=UPI0015D003BE|nr:membrane-spanning 4-domains subfamily A member 12-like isoform X2 [Electrophorus electricus]